MIADFRWLRACGVFGCFVDYVWLWWLGLCIVGGGLVVAWFVARFVVFGICLLLVCYATFVGCVNWLFVIVVYLLCMFGVACGLFCAFSWVFGCFAGFC